MIRSYIQEDLDGIVNIIRKADRMPAPAVSERLEKWTSLVWVDSATPKGVVCYEKEEDGEFNIVTYVDPDWRHRGIGSRLLDAALAAVKAMNERGRITTRYRIDLDDSQRFYRNRGFVYWYSMDYLMYDGPAMPKPNLPPGVEIRPYADEHYEGFFRVMAETFIPQRRFYDFRPHDIREFRTAEDDREKVLTNKDNMFVLLEDGKLRGVLELDDNFIDSVGVDQAAKGRGYGKALMQYAVNVLRARGHQIVETSVVLGNIPAWRLYNTLGFRRVQVDEWACMWV